MVPISWAGGMFLTKSYGLYISISFNILICQAFTRSFAVSCTFFLRCCFISFSNLILRMGSQHSLRHSPPSCISLNWTSYSRVVFPP